MPRAINPKTGHGRTAVAAPVSMSSLQEINGRIMQKMNSEDMPLFTEGEIDALYDRLHFRYASLFFNETRPAEPEQRAAIKKLERAAQQLVIAAQTYETCLDNLDIQTAKHFEIPILNEALEQAEKIHMQSMVAAAGLRERREGSGRPVKELQKGVALLLVNEIEAKHAGLLIEDYPEINHSIKTTYARYDRPSFRFIQSIMEKIFPMTKPGTIKKIIHAAINQKFKISA